MSEQKQGPDPLCKRCDGTGEVGGDYGLTPHHCDCRASPKILSEQNVQVTQADRDAAIPFVGVNFTPGMIYSDAYRIGAGELDEHPLVQAFARHRTRAEPDLVEALRKCRDQFEFYVNAHMAKQPPDMGKAATNQEFVELCDAALASAKEGG